MKNIEEIPEILEKELPETIKKIAQNYSISTYINNPHFLDERLSSWHQFGLLTHSKKVRKVFLNELGGILKKKGLYEKIHDKLNQKVDNIKRKTLFEASIPLHDLGKILAYGDKRTNRSHESLSKYLISQDPLKKRLEDLDLSEEHINYLGRCIETHYVLGSRGRDKLNPAGNFKLDYISKENIGSFCESLSKEYSDIKTELGIFFLCDSLGKTDIRINAKTDLNITNQQKNIEQIIKERNLNPNLKKAVMQLPVNVKLAEIYLRSLF